MQEITLTICGREKAAVQLTHERFDAMIAIGDSPKVDCQSLPRTWKILRFSDTTPWECQSWEDEQRLATAEHVLDIAQLAGRLEEGNRVLVCCGAGCCRSPAVAIILLLLCGYREPWLTVAQLKDNGRRGQPHGWILKLADAMLGSNLFEKTNLAFKRGCKWTSSPVEWEHSL